MTLPELVLMDRVAAMREELEARPTASLAERAQWSKRLHRLAMDVWEVLTDDGPDTTAPEHWFHIQEVALGELRAALRSHNSRVRETTQGRR